MHVRVRGSKACSPLAEQGGAVEVADIHTVGWD